MRSPTAKAEPPRAKKSAMTAIAVAGVIGRSERFMMAPLEIGVRRVGTGQVRCALGASLAWFPRGSGYGSNRGADVVHVEASGTLARARRKHPTLRCRALRRPPDTGRDWGDGRRTNRMVKRVSSDGLGLSIRMIPSGSSSELGGGSEIRSDPPDTNRLRPRGTTSFSISIRSLTRLASWTRADINFPA